MLSTNSWGGANILNLLGIFKGTLFECSLTRARALLLFLLIFIRVIIHDDLLERRPVLLLLQRDFQTTLGLSLRVISLLFGRDQRRREGWFERRVRLLVLFNDFKNDFVVIL